MKNTTRGIRNNNPLSIRHSKDRWLGADVTQTDTSFVQFKGMVFGYRAAWKILMTYYRTLSREGTFFTVRNIVSRWAPPSENPTESYIRKVLLMTGIGGQENLLPPDNVDGYGKLSRLLAAMTVMENGILPQKVDTEAICKGYKLAFPQNADALDRWLEEADEYRNW